MELKIGTYHHFIVGIRLLFAFCLHSFFSDSLKSVDLVHIIDHIHHYSNGSKKVIFTYIYETGENISNIITIN
jgi:hypothetical protein